MTQVESEVAAIAVAEIKDEREVYAEAEMMEETNDDVMDVAKLKVSELRKELKARNLGTTGNKQELMERLQGALKTTSSSKSELESEDLDEALLNEEDDDHIEANDSVLQELDSQLDATSPSSKKRKSTELEPKVPKKIVLNRSSSNSEDKQEVVVAAVEKESEKVEEKKIIKLSELTAKERLEMRAKKFGVPLSADAQKIARVERFGAENGNKESPKNQRISVAPAANVDVLKQRAERFGVSVSTALTKLENEEKLLKRKERFASASANGAKTQDEKALQRLQRFNQTV